MLLLLALGPVSRFAATSAQWLDYPYPRPGSEGLILYESLLLKRGGDIYAPITPQRFISGPYPPIYYWLAAAVLPDALPDFSTPAKVTSIFQPGRAISLVATIVAALLIPALVVFQGGYHRRGRRALVAALLGGILGGALLLSLPQVMVWATRFRGDMLMIALTAAGLTAVAVGAHNTRNGRIAGCGSWAWLILGAACFSLAFFTKQTALAGPLAAAAYLLLLDWRAGLKWCAIMGVLVIVPFGLLDIATNHWFYLKMVDYHSLPLRSLTLTRLLQFAFWEDEWPLILLALFYAGYILFNLVRHWRTRQSYMTPMLLPLFIVAALGTLPTGAVVGADHNHLLMSGLAISAGVGALVAYLLAELTGVGARYIAPLQVEPPQAGARYIGPLHGRRLYRALLWVAGGASALLLAVYLVFTSEPSSWYNPDLTQPSVQQQEQLRKIVQNVHQNPGNLFFADDPGLLALAGKETPYDDPFTMTALAETGRWDEATYQSRLQNGEFALLLLSCDVTAPASCRADTFTPGALEAIRAGYKVLFRDVMFTYAPRR